MGLADEVVDEAAFEPTCLARLTEFVLLGALAIKTGKVLKWDAVAGKVANNVPEAQPIIDGSYRKGWELAV